MNRRFMWLHKLRPLTGEGLWFSLLRALLTVCLFFSSRSWVAEEWEVFRKGTVLLGPEEMEGDYAGEELRREVRSCPGPERTPGIYLI